MERRLAAILAADVAGYSRLMTVNEADTLEQLQQHRDELIDPKVAQHHGRVVNIVGDGLLLEFASVVDAVTFAVDMQVAMRKRNLDVPLDRRMEFRIGVNVGDVIVKGDDVHGDGVNVAARLESLADAGGVCVSRSARDQVRDKLELSIDDRGEIEVKNIARPVHVFQVVLDDKASKLTTPIPIRPLAGETNSTRPSWISACAAVGALAIIGGAVSWQLLRPDVQPADKTQMAMKLPTKPSIVVLPFDNLSGDKDQGYFADGITDDLLTGLSRVSGLFVISRNTSFTYKGRPVKIRQVAEELGVRYLLEGSVRRAGSTIRINAQLIDALTSYHVWADKYDGELTDVFKLQDRVVGRILTAMASNLASTADRNLADNGTSSAQAYEANLQGKEHFFANDPVNISKAIGFLKNAIDLVAEYFAAHAALAAAYWRVFNNSWSRKVGLQTTDTVELAKQHLAIALKEPTAEAYRIAASMNLFFGKHQAALDQIDKAILIDPNYAENHRTKAEILIYSDAAQEAEKSARLAMRLNPKYSAI
jgi:adenylate cyclase